MLLKWKLWSWWYFYTFFVKYLSNFSRCFSKTWSFLTSIGSFAITYSFKNHKLIPLFVTKSCKMYTSSMVQIHFPSWIVLNYCKPFSLNCYKSQKTKLTIIICWKIQLLQINNPFQEYHLSWSCLCRIENFQTYIPLL